jgi:3'-phosphoadenosine 5'-phosphosulfate sulfotransferase (PAPS reductase)/FAD synthetase
VIKLDFKQLRYLQALPRDIKLAKTKRRIEETMYRFGIDGVYASYSGGKDSTVLMHILQSMYRNRVMSVFCDTGLEDRRLRDFAIKRADVIIKPKTSPVETITKYGYPVISKPQAMAIRKLTTHNLSPEYRNKLLYGDEKGVAGMLSAKWHYLLEADFQISEKCCEVVKKRPFHSFENKEKRIPITGMTAAESAQRAINYVREGGCNAFDINHPHSQPLGFWTDQDILCYIYEYGIEIAPPYGDVEFRDGTFCTTCERRTGCQYCGFGVHMEPKDDNRFLRMKKTDPQLYDYCIRGGKYKEEGKWVPHKGLGMWHVLDTINVKY